MIDQLVVNSRVKSSCELLEEATLATRFEFDIPYETEDIGPNDLPGDGDLYSFVPAMRSPQAIYFQGSNESHFRIEGVSPLGITNQSFSIVFWVNPQNLSGALIHLGSVPDGRSWCMPYMGFNGNGSLFVQILSGGVKSVLLTDLLPVQSWSHIAQTWSPTNGLRLYVNSTLMASNPSLTSNSASGVPMYVFIASGVAGLFHCARCALTFRQPFPGAIDDFRIYSRELTDVDLCTIQNS